MKRWVTITDTRTGEILHKGIQKSSKCLCCGGEGVVTEFGFDCQGRPTANRVKCKVCEK